MTATTQSRRSKSHTRPPVNLRPRGPHLDHAVRLIYRICCLAGSAAIIEEIDEDGSLRSAIAKRDTPALYDWLISALSYQGISDQVAFDYMERHGRPTWRDIERNLA